MSDQFPIGEKIGSNGSLGNDWLVMRTGTNDQGQSIYERYGAYRPVSKQPAPLGGAIDVWGYGTSETCIVNKTQQHSAGFVTEVEFTWYRHTADTTGGNSGSGLLYNDEIVGIVTHCSSSNPNLANRIDLPAIESAIQELCPATLLGDLNDDGAVNVSDLLILLGDWGDCTVGQACEADLDGNSVVNVSDLLLLLGEWG